MALEWFEPDLLSSSNPGSHPLWMDDWTEFIIELQSTFGPHKVTCSSSGTLVQSVIFTAGVPIIMLDLCVDILQ
ncbi:hypothetical protein ID866_12634 [Astraeus odoratus]|nr:hypothetical protein ID866_12634 [Astraeus odoratus]